MKHLIGIDLRWLETSFVFGLALWKPLTPWFVSKFWRRLRRSWDDAWSRMQLAGGLKSLWNWSFFLLISPTLETGKHSRKLSQNFLKVLLRRFCSDYITYREVFFSWHPLVKPQALLVAGLIPLFWSTIDRSITDLMLEDEEVDEVASFAFQTICWWLVTW